MLVSTSPYLSHALSPMYAKKIYAWICKEKISPPPSARTNGGAWSGRLRLPQTLLYVVQMSGLFLHLFFQPNLSLKNFLHAFPYGWHESSESWVGSTAKKPGHHLLQEFVRRGLSLGIFGLNTRSPDSTEITVISTCCLLWCNKYSIIRVKDIIR